MYTATSEIYTLSLHDALPIYATEVLDMLRNQKTTCFQEQNSKVYLALTVDFFGDVGAVHSDRKSTRLNSSHLDISYAVFYLKKKKKTNTLARTIHAYDAESSS